jgi:phosphate acetyltransferase
VTLRIAVLSAEGRTAKSTVAVGLLDALTRDTPDARVGVFRPVARSLEEPDPVLDALAAHGAAATGVGVDDERVHADPEVAVRRIVAEAAKLEESCDALLVLGSDYTGVGAPTELSMNGRIAADLGAAVVLVLNGLRPGGSGFRTPAELADAARVAVAELRNDHAGPAAIVVNRADPDNLASLASAVDTAVGGPVHVIPEDPLLDAPSLRRLAESLEATLVKGRDDHLERPVLGTVVAGMSVENLLPRLIEGGVVVVPADRADALLGVVLAERSAAFPTPAAIVLNGGLPMAEAVERLIDGLDEALPFLACEWGTFETARRIDATRSLLAAESEEKYQQALELFRGNVDGAAIVRSIREAPPGPMTPHRFEYELLERARHERKHIVLPEGDDDRVIEAAAAVLRDEIADLTILGDEAVVRARAAELGFDLDAATITSVDDPELHERFAAEYHRLRQHKGIDAATAAETVRDVSFFGTMMVHLGLADGMVSGARHTTAHTITPSFQIIKTKPGISVVSSVFLMVLADRVLVYGDCAVIPEPTREQLADIAIASAATARQFGIEPRVAMLSYSTGESGSGGEVDDVRAATALVKERAPELPVAGPIQYDAAADPTVGDAKLPGSDVAGRATVFVFPDLNTGNNTYKAVQRSAGALAIGPVLQGLNKPVNDLSRGALVRDIINTIAVTAIQAQEGS